MAHSALAWLSALVVLAAACAGEEGSADVQDDEEPTEQPEFPVRDRTRYFDVAPGFVQPVCRGTLDAMDRQVEVVASMLDIEVSIRSTVYWFNEHATGATASTTLCDWCSRCGACYGGEGVVFSDRDALMHEIVHAVVIPAWGGSDIVFSEGVAMALDGRHTSFPRYPSERPSAIAGGSRHGGAHFTRWLLERFGPAKLRALFEPRLHASSTKDDVFAAVEAVYGVPFLELEAEFLATAPSIYPAVGLCDGLEHVPSQGNLWELTAAVDCEAPQFFGPRDEDAAVELSVTLDLPALPDVPITSVLHPATHGRLTPCIEAPQYDVDDPAAAVRDLGVGNGLVFSSPGGRYRLTLPMPEAGEVHVRICPWNGRHPTVGEQDPDLCLDG